MISAVRLLALAAAATLPSVLAFAGPLARDAAAAERKLGWPATPFSGRLEIQNGEARGNQRIAMTVYSAGANLRLDFRQNGQPLSIILNRRARRMVAVSHARKQVVLLPYRPQSDIARMFSRARGVLTREAVETVNGVRAVRYKFEGKNADGDTFSGRVWITRQRIVVRMLEDEKRPGKVRPFQMNLRGLKVGRLPAGTFAAPKGYAVVNATRKAQGREAR